MRWIIPILIASMILGTTGCTKVYTDRVARHSPGRDMTLAKAPRTGVYQVHYNDGLGNKVKPMPGTSVFFMKGEAMGFMSSNPEHFFAVAQERTIPLPTLKRRGSGYLWYLAERRQTQFGREVQEVVIGTGQVLGVAAYLVFEGMLLAVDCEDDAWNERAYRHKDRRSAREDSPKPFRPASPEERDQPIYPDHARGLKVPLEPRIK